jgi:hypothetical protein
MLDFDIADMWYWVLCWGGGRKTPDVGCCTQHESQHGSLGYYVGGGGGKPLMLDATRNMTHNMGHCTFRRMGSVALNLTSTEAFDSSVRNYLNRMARKLDWAGVPNLLMWSISQWQVGRMWYQLVGPFGPQRVLFYFFSNGSCSFFSN